ncbi:MAG: NPCBM/NEW2 domain-containing protein, partial [bacterium]
EMPSTRQFEALELWKSFKYFHIRDLDNPDGARVKYLSDWISKATPGHAVDVEANIKGADSLLLVVTSGGDSSRDHADWIEPRLTGPAGELPLTGLKWDLAQSGWKAPVTNRSVAGTPLKIMGLEITNGIGTHAASIIKYTLPKGYDRFRARAALDDSGTSQGTELEMSAVQFAVLTGTPSKKQIRLFGAAGSWIRFRVDALPPGKDALSITAHLKFHSAPWQTAEFKLTPDPIRTNGFTPWIDLAKLPGNANGPLILAIPEGAKGATQFAVLELDNGVIREIPWNEPNGREVIVAPGFDDILTFRDQERRYYLHAAGICPDRLFPLTRSSLLFANAWGWATGGAAEYMVKSFRLLGLNCVATSEDTVKYESLYGWGSQGGHYAPPAFVPYDSEKALKSYREHYEKFFAAQAGKKSSPGMVSFQMSDEPGEIAVKGPEADAGFQVWLQQQNLKPPFFHKDKWEQVTLFTGKPTTPEDQRRYYWSRRYQGLMTPRMFGLACEGFCEASPAKLAKPFVALSGHSLNFGNKLSLDMFELARYPHLTPGISDWMSNGSWFWDSHQSVAFSVAPFNAGARRYGKDFGQPPISFPMMHCVWPSLFRAYTQIANQCKLISYYNYGPDYMVTEGFWSSSDWSRYAVHHIDNQAAQVDDILGPGRMRPSRVALLYSLSTEYRWPQITFRDKRATFLALSHEYYQPELVTEDQIEAGALQHYDALVVLDQWVTVAAQKDIETWVRKGGLLLACADAAVRNEYDEPLDLLNELTGLKRTFGDAAAGPGLQVDPVTNEASFTPHEVPADGRPLTIVAGKARVRATYGDGQPAWLEHPAGKGKVVYIGHRVGLSYSRRAGKKRDLSLWPTSGREFLVQPLLDAHVPRELEISKPLVMAMPLSAEGGTVVPLFNMTDQACTNFTLRLHESAPPFSVQWINPETLAPTNLPYEYADGWLTITIQDLSWHGNMVCVRTRPAPPDDRVEKMRKATGAQLADPDWQTLSAGAWTAGFFPDWGLASRLEPLLKHEHWAVRRSAAESLGRLRYKDASQALRAAFDKETDAHALADELIALARLGAADTDDLAVKLADHSSPAVRDALKMVLALPNSESRK